MSFPPLSAASVWLRMLCAAVVALGGLALPAHAEDAGIVVLAVGDARLGDEAAKGGATVRVGDRLTTGGSGYIHIKTVDNGFLILRPQSAARVVAYHIDAQTPANSRFKIELERGVARSISGDAVKHARQNFRFNTPVAAIGVRGTDFTVSTDEQATRIQVVAGGIVASGFGGTCQPDGGGPCEGPMARELFATQGGQMLLINRGQSTPQLLRGSLTPQGPAPSEPGLKAGNADAASNLQEPNLAPLKLAGLDVRNEGPSVVPPTVPAEPPAPPTILWGRWQAVADLPADVDLNNSPAYKVAGINSYYAMLVARNAVWQAPTGGVVSFALQGAEAGVRIDGNNALQAANIQNGKLAIDFNNSTFTTQFDLLTQSQRLQLQAQGGVGGDGTFSNPSQFLGSNMVVQGILANAPSGGLNAAYLFQSRLDDKRVAYGVTYWGK